MFHSCSVVFEGKRTHREIQLLAQTALIVSSSNRVFSKATGSRAGGVFFKQQTDSLACDIQSNLLHPAFSKPTLNLRLWSTSRIQTSCSIIPAACEGTFHASTIQQIKQFQPDTENVERACIGTDVWAGYQWVHHIRVQLCALSEEICVPIHQGWISYAAVVCVTAFGAEEKN